MLSTEDNRLLTSVGRGTPAGEFMRRYWLPVGLSADLGERPPLIRILGEDLVLFRTKDGAAGVPDARCSHRGASLAYGCVGKGGAPGRDPCLLYHTPGPRPPPPR